MDRVEAGRPLSFCSGGELFSQDQTSSETWEGQRAQNMIRRGVKMQAGTGELGKARGVYCFRIANSKACYVFISLSSATFLPRFPPSPPKLLTLTALQLEDMIAC